MTLLFALSFFNIAGNGCVFVFVWGVGTMFYPPDIKLPKSGVLPKPISAQIK